MNGKVKNIIIECRNITVPPYFRVKYQLKVILYKQIYGVFQ